MEHVHHVVASEIRRQGLKRKVKEICNEQRDQKQIGRDRSGQAVIFRVQLLSPSKKRLLSEGCRLVQLARERERLCRRDAQRNGPHRRGARLQSRSFARWNPRLTESWPTCRVFRQLPSLEAEIDDKMRFNFG